MKKYDNKHFVHSKLIAKFVLQTFKTRTMKRMFLVIAIAFAFASVSQAQELVTKKGFKILPEAGDYSIGFNAVPVVDFFLNVSDILDNTGQTAQHPGYVGGFNQVLVGKYFLEDNKAIRGRLAINTNKVTNKTYFDSPADVFNGIAEPAEFEDKNVVGNTNIILGGGLEFRRGHNRLQGFYGGEVLLGFGMNSVKNTWAVEMNQDAINNAYTNGDGSLVAAGRILEQKSGMAITFGLRGFAGVEYFFAPKISVGAEFGWGLGLTTNPRGSQTVETWDAVNNVALETEASGNNSGSAWGFQVDNGAGQLLLPTAALTMNFHF